MVKSIFLRDDDTYDPRILIVSIILLFVVLFFIFTSAKTEIVNDDSCGDGTPNGFCSVNRPYYCLGGVLTEKSSLCGCPANFEKQGERCFSSYETNPENLELSYILRGEKKTINFTVYAGMAEYILSVPREISYVKGEVPTREDFKLKKINEEIQRQLLLPLVVQIQNLDKNKEEQMRIAVSIVQNMEWGYSNKTIQFGHNQITYSRYPYEVIYESQGLCGEKSELLVFLLRELGFDVAIFYNQFENHESVGIKCPKEYSWHNSGYCFIETSGPSIISNSDIDYVGGLKISSKPQLILISNGTSLGDELYEYQDSKDFMEIRQKIAETGRANQLEILKLEELEKKYGLLDEYNVA